jgi:hypothetical protein
MEEPEKGKHDKNQIRNLFFQMLYWEKAVGEPRLGCARAELFFGSRPFVRAGEG